MRKFALIAALFACGGAPEEEWVDTTVYDVPNIFVPGQEGRIDLTVWHDGYFSSPEAKESFCGEHGDMPEAWFCREPELGTARQGWEVAEYHGMASEPGWVCYGPAATAVSGDCLFPYTTWMRVVSSYTGCFSGPPTPGAPWPSTLQEQAILDGIKDGMYTWHNAGAGWGYNVPARVVANGSPGSSSYMPVSIGCGDLPGTHYANGGLTGAVTNITGNAPIGPHSGKDQDDLRTVPAGIMTVDILKIWQDAGSACGGGANVTPANLRNFARSIGAHEGGHVFGFSHFNQPSALNSNVMAPARNPNLCNSAAPILERYHVAVGFFQTGGAGPDTVTDQSLYLQSPL